LLEQKKTVIGMLVNFMKEVEQNNGDMEKQNKIKTVIKIEKIILSLIGEI
jgi:hypothetical protein